MNAKTLPAHSLSSTNVIHCGDALAVLRGMPTGAVHTIVTSPPYYGLRNYNDVPGQIGLEMTPEEYVARLVAVMREARRVLRDDGTMWINLGDSYVGSTSQHRGTESQGHNSVISAGTYGAVPSSGRRDRTLAMLDAGLKPKDLIGIPWRVAFALQADGWYLRSDIVWHKPAPMPESVRDRPTRAHEYIFLLSKSPRYYYDADAIREPLADSSMQRIQQRTFEQQRGGDKDYSNGVNKSRSMRRALENFAKDPTGANKRTVWTVSHEPSPLPHYAMFPSKLIEPCILAGAPAQACVVCGAPYERIVEREPMVVRKTARAEQMGEYGRTCTSGTMITPPTSTTVGWQPTCECNADTRPGVVLDPFMGAGTTALTAMRLGRDYIGIELDADTAAMAAKRVRYGGDDRRLMAEEAAGVEQITIFDMLESQL